MSIQDENLSRILRHDPLANAERMTGASYKEDPETIFLGLIGHIEHIQKKNEAMLEAGDTIFSNEIGRYKRIISEEGFEPVLCLPFSGRSYGGEKPVAETFEVWFNRTNGILLRFDTYGADHVNGGSFYYNWIPSTKDGPYVTSSGGYYETTVGLVWAGDHDAREALRLKIRMLRDNGRFVTPWLVPAQIWMSDYGFGNSIEKLEWPERLRRYDEENERRIALLPVFVRTAIGRDGRDGLKGNQND